MTDQVLNNPNHDETLRMQLLQLGGVGRLTIISSLSGISEANIRVYMNGGDIPAGDRIILTMYADGSLV